MWWHKARPAVAVPPQRARAPKRGTPRHGVRASVRPVQLEGNLSGDITTTEPVIVGETAVVRANIRAPSIIIMGDVFGDVTASVSIELRYPARLTGNLAAPQIVIEPGVVFSGACRMEPTPPTP